ncbi:DUF669 domain-containing protein [Magnetococcus sp. PR-3]|uniref:DUF669 domain-containing protein n=1 Tax=Magnetococcus sp. PR-3 TaxID=3120355 RepID=UPI002FCE1EA8
MANLGGTFDASQVDPSKPQENLPPGDYRVQIINSEMRVTKAGTGQYLWLEMDVLEGVHAGRKVYDRLNLINPNNQAVEISQRALSAICHALGRMQVQDSEDLHFQPLIAKVSVGKSGYNEVKGYKPVGGAPTAQPQTVPPVQQQPAQGQQPPPPTASGDGPWKRMGQ